MKWLRSKPSYTQEEISEQIYQIKQLTELRDKAKSKDEVERYNTAIEVAQEILGFMYETVENSHKR